MIYPYIKTMKIQNMPQTTLLPLSLLPLSIFHFGNKAPKRKAKVVMGWRRRVLVLGLGVKRSASSSSEESPEGLGVAAGVGGGAAEVTGAEDVASSATTLVDSVKGADVTRTESDVEGRTTIGRSGSNCEGDSNMSVVISSD
jgi:hypothetical protein